MNFKGIVGVLFWICLLTIANGAGVGKASMDKENSDITVIKIKPLFNTSAEESNNRKLKTNFRSSRIENLPLQIKPIISPNPVLSRTPGNPKIEVVRTPRNSDKNNETQFEYTTEKSELDYENNESEARFDLSEAVTPAATEIVEEVKTEVPSSSTEAERTSSWKKGYANKIFSIKNKHSKKYFYGNLDNYDPSYRKYIETRRFRSRCRCERIWNCPKLQLSVPRCPPDYFMCCF